MRALPILLIVGCGGGSDNAGSDQQLAQEVFLAAYSESVDLQQQALAASAVTSQLDFSGPCGISGSEAITGTYDDGGGVGSEVTFTLDITFNNCNTEFATIDGDEHWEKVADPRDEIETTSGSIGFSGDNLNSGTLVFDITSVLNPLTGAFTYTGTFSVNGVSYTVDPSIWGSP
jgi:hypothetical protein